MEVVKTLSPIELFAVRGALKEAQEAAGRFNSFLIMVGLDPTQVYEIRDDGSVLVEASGNVVPLHAVEPKEEAPSDEE